MAETRTKRTSREGRITSAHKGKSRGPAATFLKASLAGIGLAFVAVLLLPVIRDWQQPSVPNPEATSAQRASPSGKGPQEAVRAASPVPATAPLKTAQLPEATEDAPAATAEPDDDAVEPEVARDDLDESAASTGETADDPEDAAGGTSTDEAAADAAPVAEDDDTFPKAFSRREMDEALKPVLDFKLGDDDLKAVREAIALVDKRQFAAAQTAIANLANGPARSFATWYYLRLADLGATATEIERFIESQPLFPAQGTLTKRLETALFWNEAPKARVEKFLSGREPVTGVGRALVGEMLIANGEKDRGENLIRTVWRSSPLDSAIEGKFVARFGAHLSPQDHELRKKSQEFQAGVKAALAAPSSSAKKPRSQKGRSHRPKSKMRKGAPKAVKTRKGQGSKARPATRKKRSDAKGFGQTLTRTALGLSHALISPAAAATPDRKLGDKAGDPFADMPLPTKRADAVKGGPAPKTAQEKAAENAVALSKELKASPAQIFARVRALRRASNNAKAWSLLRSTPPELSDLLAPEIWWAERRIHVRAALDEGRARTAYAIASRHGPLLGEDLAEAQFLSGWIAYRFLKDLPLAEKHFAESKAADALPRDVARASYFLGRVKQDLGRAGEAEADFLKAAEHYYTYYGQLGDQAQHQHPPCQFRPPVRPTDAQIKAFVENDAVRAVAIARQLDLDRVVRVLLVGFARELSDPAYMTLALELARRTAPPNFVVRIAKAALNRGFAVDVYSFPAALPSFEALAAGGDVENALLHALTRQESEFNTGAQSPVGARGLMQLMPATARMVASQHKVKFDLSRLTSDPKYNVMLGAAFLDNLISSYRGSYVMAVAAYNAGPGRVRQWVASFGDPRTSAVDPVDWVERIPFTETRNYVQRVLEGLQLYRCRFKNAQSPVLLAHDLLRGRRDVPAVIEAGAAGN